MPMPLEASDESAKVRCDKQLVPFRFLEEHRHVALIGPVGVGRTCLAHAPGNAQRPPKRPANPSSPSIPAGGRGAGLFPSRLTARKTGAVAARLQNGTCFAFRNLDVTSPESAMLSGSRTNTGAPAFRLNRSRLIQTTLGAVVSSKK